jgi:hypothetical protein
VSSLLRDDLQTRAFRWSKGHLLTPLLKEIRQTRTERLLQWHAENGHENILITDEKIFTIDEQYYRQDDKIRAEAPRGAMEKVSRVQRVHHPSYVMVCWGGPIRG